MYTAVFIDIDDSGIVYKTFGTEEELEKFVEDYGQSMYNHKITFKGGKIGYKNKWLSQIDKARKKKTADVEVAEGAPKYTAVIYDLHDAELMTKMFDTQEDLKAYVKRTKGIDFRHMMTMENAEIPFNETRVLKA